MMISETLLPGNYRYFKVIVILFLLYAALFIYRNTHVIDGERYFFLFDDAMISMRYAKNLANGHGLVWNPGGERVEGYTNPLWVLFMALCHFLPIAAARISLVVQASGAILLALNLFYVRKIAHLQSGGSAPAVYGAVIMTAFYLPLNTWGLLGMEVSLLVLITSMAIWHSMQCLKKKRFSPSLYLLLGISTLVRPDMVVPFGSLLLFLAYNDIANRKKNLLFGSFVLLLFVAIQTGFRFWYYGELLPNTYYLKLTGYPFYLRISRGLFVFYEFIRNLNPLIFFLPFIMLFFQRSKLELLLLWVFVVQAAYSIYVGGDAWEWWGGANRYISIAIPGFFILIASALSSFSQSIAAKIVSDNLSSSTKNYVFIVLLIVSFCFVNSIHGPKALAEVLLLEQTLDVADNKKNIEVALLLRKISTPQAQIAVAWGGNTPYFTERYYIDLLGKNDKHVARMKARTTPGTAGLTAFHPGHQKYDYGYSIGELKPDIVTRLWRNKDEANPYLKRMYRRVSFEEYDLDFSIRIDSENILLGSKFAE